MLRMRGSASRWALPPMRKPFASPLAVVFSPTRAVFGLFSSDHAVLGTVPTARLVFSSPRFADLRGACAAKLNCARQSREELDAAYCRSPFDADDKNIDEGRVESCRCARRVRAARSFVRAQVYFGFRGVPLAFSSAKAPEASTVMIRFYLTRTAVVFLARLGGLLSDSVSSHDVSLVMASCKRL